jgi:hypothetical protein
MTASQTLGDMAQRFSRLSGESAAEAAAMCLTPKTEAERLGA